MPLKPIKIKSRIESLIQDIKQADYAFDAYDAYVLAVRLRTLYKNNKIPVRKLIVFRCVEIVGTITICPVYIFA